jgi:hypothetical protein
VKYEARTRIVTTAQQQKEFHTFQFDHIYGPDTEQESVFQEVARPILDCTFTLHCSYL